jgi:hypothetical protein
VELVRTDLVAVALVAGVLSLAVAAALPTRREPAVGSRRVRGLARLVPRLGLLLTGLLLVRGATAGAAAVGLATATHVLLGRVRGSAARR